MGGEAGVGKTRLVNEFVARATARRGDRAGRWLRRRRGRRAAARAVRRGAARPCARARRRRPRELWRRGSWLGCCRTGRAAPSRRRAQRLGQGACSSSRSACWGAWRPTARWCSCSRTCTGRIARRATCSRSSCATCAPSGSWSWPRTAPTSSTAGIRCAPFLAELDRGRRIDAHRPAPVQTARSWPSTRRASSARRPERALVESVFERSQGNAFFAEELVDDRERGRRRELPPMLRDILLVRIESRSAAAQELLRVVAAGGGRVPERLLAAVSELSEAQRDEALREAVEHRLLVPAGEDVYAFRHALLREAVYQELLPGERNRLHAACGAALAAQPELAGGPDAAAADLAYHWYAAHDLPRALAASVAAGRVAEQRSGFAEARAHYERALELWDRVADAEARAGLDLVALTLRAAEVANLAGDHGRAAALIRGALADVGDADRRGAAVGAAGALPVGGGRQPDRARGLRGGRAPGPGRAAVGGAGARARRARPRADAALAPPGVARVLRGGDRDRARGRRPGRGGPRARTRSAATSGTSATRRRRSSTCVRAREIAAEVGDLDDLARAYLNLVRAARPPAQPPRRGARARARGHRAVAARRAGGRLRRVAADDRRRRAVRAGALGRGRGAPATTPRSATRSRWRRSTCTRSRPSCTSGRGAFDAAVGAPRRARAG